MYIRVSKYPKRGISEEILQCNYHKPLILEYQRLFTSLVRIAHELQVIADLRDIN